MTDAKQKITDRMDQFERAIFNAGTEYPAIKKCDRVDYMDGSRVYILVRGGEARALELRASGKIFVDGQPRETEHPRTLVQEVIASLPVKRAAGPKV